MIRTNPFMLFNCSQAFKYIMLWVIYNSRMLRILYSKPTWLQCCCCIKKISPHIWVNKAKTIEIFKGLVYTVQVCSSTRVVQYQKVRVQAPAVPPKFSTNILKSFRYFGSLISLWIMIYDAHKQASYKLYTITSLPIIFYTTGSSELV